MLRTQAEHEYRRRALLAIGGLLALFWALVGYAAVLAFA